MLYDLVDKFLMNDFTKIISDILNKQKKDYLTIFDVGCFKGNFSRNLKKKIGKKHNFYLFDANPNLDIKDFDYTKLAFSDGEGFKKFYLNRFFPASGSSLKTIVLEDKLWNFTRQLITGKFGKQYDILEVKTETIDNFCSRKKIENIDVLKIDTEGTELEILIGAKNILSKTDIILIEVLDQKKIFKQKCNEIINFLEKRNFKKILQKNMWSLGTLSNMSAVDILFKKNDL